MLNLRNETVSTGDEISQILDALRTGTLETRSTHCRLLLLSVYKAFLKTSRFHRHYKNTTL